MKNPLEYKLYRLLALKLSGDATSEELAAIDTILELHPGYRFLHDQLLKPEPVNIAKITKAEQAYAVHAVKLQLSESGPGSAAQPSLRAARAGTMSPYLKYIAATAVLLIVGCAAFFYFKGRTGAGMPNEIATTNGSRSAVKLPDGSTVLLNANSKLSYSQTFKGKLREVRLEGEAFFDIASDAKRPFIIHTPEGEIKVLGTAFNVRSFADGTFETALIRGKVAIRLYKKGSESFVLEPGQKLVYKNAELRNADPVQIQPIIKKDSLIAETSWTKGRLVFVDKPLEDITSELERVFGVKIIFKSPVAKRYRYTGVFEDSDLNHILEILMLAKDFHYQQNKDQIFIE
ncbi:FecR family protein [Niabella hirudinis]|uniref:FecR family protein n=1 Tax=Niabella hirudinis TaxID=1285929 RepID=UPI003EB7DEF8